MNNMEALTGRQRRKGLAKRKMWNLKERVVLEKGKNRKTRKVKNAPEGEAREGKDERWGFAGWTRLT